MVRVRAASLGISFAALLATAASAQHSPLLPKGLTHGDWGRMVDLIRHSEYAPSRVQEFPLSDRPAGWQAPNRAQDFRVYFTSQGVELVPRREREPSWRLDMALQAWGAGGARHPARPAEPVVSGHRVTYRRSAGLVEWFENTEKGLEHGWTVADPPAGNATAPLSFELALRGGWRAEPAGGDTAVRLSHPSGAVLRYRGLRAWDARGRPLRARMEPAGGGLTVTVAAQRASFPITVDPDFVQEAQLLPTAEEPAGEESARCGASVALDSATALVGCPYFDLAAAYQGAVFVFELQAAAWVRTARLTAAEPVSGDGFGLSVALAGDTALVGAPQDDHPGVNAGSAYVFVRSGSTWSEQQRLSAVDAGASDSFGRAVALSGDTALIGAPYNDHAAANAGSAYVFVRSGSTWTQEAQLIAADPSADDSFGASVALAGQTALVGVPSDRHPAGTAAGSAYVFVRSASTWTQQQRLFAGDASDYDGFGYAVALAGETALVGAPYDDDGLFFPNRGSAYVFTRSGVIWSEQQKLQDGVGRFGTAVALAGDTALIGAPQDENYSGGSASVFARSGSVWSLQQQLHAADTGYRDGFGEAVALAADLALVGAPADDHQGGVDAGSSYVFQRAGTTWTERQRLFGEDSAYFDHFGWSVALAGDTALVGAPFDNSSAGSVYVFVRSGSSWSEQQKLFASDGQPSSFFGDSVAVEGDTAIVGAPDHDTSWDGTDAGAAYVFVRSGSTWTEQQRLQAPDGAAYDSFGTSVALAGDTVLVGAPFVDQAGGSDAGAAYVFTRSGSTWTAGPRLSASDGDDYDYFGISVALSASTALIGAGYDDNAGGGAAGSAYVFSRSGSAWSEQQHLFASDGDDGDLFGISVALSGDTALIGALFDDHAGVIDAGSAYVFTRSGSIWTEQQRLFASDAAERDFFGNRVALSGNTAVAGASGDDHDGGTDAGSVYVFTRSGATWTQEPRLSASATHSDDFFGSSVAVSGSSILVGADTEDQALGGDAGSAYVFTAPTSQGDFFPLTPCRAKDTRVTGPLADGESFEVELVGVCGVGASAKAVSINVTVTAPSAAGQLTLYPGAAPPPDFGVIRFYAGQTRANNQVLMLTPGGKGTLRALATIPGGGTVHLIVDINGYFE